jgi:BON domain
VKPLFSLKPLLLGVLICTFFLGCRTNETPEAQVTDFQISANVKTKLASDLGLSTVTNISVNATNGVVTLAGMVTTADQKSKAEGIAKSVPHVVRVVNNLQVSRASTSSRVDWGRLRQPPSQLPPGRRYAI